jgi:transposase
VKKGFGKGSGVGPRLRRAERSQRELIPSSLDEVLPEDHQARDIWQFVRALDLSAFTSEIKSAGSSPGHPAIDPAILVTLWVFANSEGVGSARELDRLCERDIAYRWICGGVGVNHHTLSDFRVDHGTKVDKLLTQVIGLLTTNGVIKMQQVAQDGTRVRASAGASSFRREKTLQVCLEEAAAQVDTLRAELGHDAGASTRRVAAAKQRAAEARRAAVEAALAQFPEVNQQREVMDKKNKKRAETKGAPRVSTTDPEARVMKMADGGYRPAFNVQFATDVDSGCLVGVNVTNQGTDSHQLEPMVVDILERTGVLPKDYLVDGGYRGHHNIEGLAAAGVTTYAPVLKPKKAGVDPFAPRPDDTPVIADWRARMATDEAKQIYAQRGATAERVNADLKTHRGLGAFNVRGLEKVKAVVLLSALTFNILRCLAESS